MKAPHPIRVLDRKAKTFLSDFDYRTDKTECQIKNEKSKY